MRWFLIPLICCAIGLAPLPARAADTLQVIVVDGDEAANIVAERIAAEPAIEVRDKDDRRVPGAVVRFVIRKTRDRLIATFGNGQAEVRTLTDYSGRASVNAVSPVEPGSFQIDVEVSYRGQTGKAVIRQTNFATSADAKSAGRDPGKSTNSTTQAATTGAATSVAAGATTAATAGGTTAATTAAVSAGGGMSKLAVIGIVAGGAAGAGAAVVLSRKEGEPAGAVGAVVASQAIGVEGATPFTFSVQATGFDAASVTYRWEFGDGATSTEPAPNPHLRRGWHLRRRGNGERLTPVGAFRDVGNSSHIDRHMAGVRGRDQAPARCSSPKQAAASAGPSPSNSPFRLH